MKCFTRTSGEVAGQNTERVTVFERSRDRNICSTDNQSVFGLMMESNELVKDVVRFENLNE